MVESSLESYAQALLHIPALLLHLCITLLHLSIDILHLSITKWGDTSAEKDGRQAARRPGGVGLFLGEGCFMRWLEKLTVPVPITRHVDVRPPPSARPTASNV